MIFVRRIKSVPIGTLLGAASKPLIDSDAALLFSPQNPSSSRPASTAITKSRLPKNCSSRSSSLAILDSLPVGIDRFRRGLGAPPKDRRRRFSRIEPDPPASQLSDGVFERVDRQSSIVLDIERGPRIRSCSAIAACLSCGYAHASRTFPFCSCRQSIGGASNWPGSGLPGQLPAFAFFHPPAGDGLRLPDSQAQYDPVQNSKGGL